MRVNNAVISIVETYAISQEERCFRHRNTLVIEIGIITIFLCQFVINGRFYFRFRFEHLPSQYSAVTFADGQIFDPCAWRGIAYLKSIGTIGERHDIGILPFLFETVIVEPFSAIDSFLLFAFLHHVWTIPFFKRSKQNVEQLLAVSDVLCRRLTNSSFVKPLA